LVDWLENDRSQHVRRTYAKTYVKSRPVLTFCGEISNGSKHAKLQARKVQVSLRKTILGSYPMEDESGQQQEHAVEGTQLFIRWGEDLIEADNFARQCIEEWDRF